MKKALIAMSGGVDSSVCAYLMVKDGYECIGATMKLYENETAGIKKSKTCCSLDDIEDARSVAYNLSMKYYVFNFTKEFKDIVINNFISAYESGKTPNPCIECNRYMKFKKLLERAITLGYDYIVTGHYARIEKKNDRYLLKKAVDLSKDQSYVLYSLTQDELSHTLFPLGSLKKSYVREIAEKNGFINARKHDSQDICFVPDRNYAKVIEINTGKKYKTGNFVDENNNIIGVHKGIIHYTIGQRKGLGVSFGKPMYVKEKNMTDNTVVLCENKNLYENELIASDLNWIAFDFPPLEFKTKAKIRYNQVEQSVTVKVIGENKVKVIFDEPQRAITKGQAVVFYDGDVVLGGGTIE